MWIVLAGLVSFVLGFWTGWFSHRQYLLYKLNKITVQLKSLVNTVNAYTMAMRKNQDKIGSIVIKDLFKDKMD